MVQVRNAYFALLALMLGAGSASADVDPYYGRATCLDFGHASEAGNIQPFLDWANDRLELLDQQAVVLGCSPAVNSRDEAGEAKTIASMCDHVDTNMTMAELVQAEYGLMRSVAGLGFNNANCRWRPGN